MTTSPLKRNIVPTHSAIDICRNTKKNMRCGLICSILVIILSHFQFFALCTAEQPDAKLGFEHIFMMQDVQNARIYLELAKSHSVDTVPCKKYYAFKCKKWGRKSEN